jgi:hypothetical protein
MTATRPGVRPSLYDIVFIIWAVVAPVGFGSRLINSDGDLARHLRLGEIMLARHGLLHQDVFSFTRGGQPFLAFEYGSELLYALAYRLAGLAGVAVLAGLVLALTYALVARFMVRRGGDPFLAYLVSMVAAVLGASHWLARPHLFTLLLVVVLLELLQHPTRRALLAYPALFVVWANLHGGFSFGCILIAVYAVGEALEGLITGERAVWFGRARHHVAALGLGLLASLLNPNGLSLLGHVFGFFGNDAILRQTQEFFSPDFHTINGKIFLAVLLAVVAALAVSRRRPPATTLLVLLATVAFALISQRNIELFALTGLPLVALHLDAEWRALPFLSRPKAVFQREHAGRYPGVGAATVSFLLAGLALAGGSVAGIAVIPARFDERSFPVRAVEKARAERLEGRMYNNFIWGGYLLLAWPEQRVFIDGGTDHYGEKLFNEWIQVWNLDQGWRDVLARWKISFVLVPPDSRLADELVRDHRWDVWYRDSTAVILRRPGGESDSTGAAGQTSSSEVPGGLRAMLDSTNRAPTASSPNTPMASTKPRSAMSAALPRTAGPSTSY